jgi:hypothetical protein
MPLSAPPRPRVSWVEQAFDSQKSFFDAQAAAIQVSNHIGWQDVRVEYTGQVAISGRTEVVFDQTQGMY